MSKLEVIKEMMNSNNGGLYAAIGGIVLVYGIDRVVGSHYRVEGKKDSLTIEPAPEQSKPQTPAAVQTEKAAPKKTAAKQKTTK